MKAPVLAALAPGVVVSGRMVSAISSRRATSAAVNVADPLGHRLFHRRRVESEGVRRIAPAKAQPAHQRDHALHGVAACHAVHRILRVQKLPRFSSSTANAEARAQPPLGQELGEVVRSRLGKASRGAACGCVRGALTMPDGVVPSAKIPRITTRPPAIRRADGQIHSPTIQEKHAAPKALVGNPLDPDHMVLLQQLQLLCIGL